MNRFLVLAAMRGEFLALSGNIYENFQMLGYVDANSSFEAVKIFFDNPPFPIDWKDVRYMWAEPLIDNDDSGHYGEYTRIHLQDLIN